MDLLWLSRPRAHGHTVHASGSRCTYVVCAYLVVSLPRYLRYPGMYFLRCAAVCVRSDQHQGRDTGPGHRWHCPRGLGFVADPQSDPAASCPLKFPSGELRRRWGRMGSSRACGWFVVRLMPEWTHGEMSGLCCLWCRNPTASPFSESGLAAWTTDGLPR